jgi:hypothetical protein
MAYMYSSDLDDDYWDFVHKMEVWAYDRWFGCYVFIDYCFGDLEAMDWEDDGYFVTELGGYLP